MRRFFTAGFSVLELVIYIAVLVTALAVVVDSLLRVQPVLARGRLLRSVNTSGEFIMQKMIREIRLANNIDAASSAFDAHPGALALDTVVSFTDETPTTAVISLNSGQLQIQRSGQSAEILNYSDVDVTNIIFRNVTQSSVSKAVKIELTLEARKGTSTVTSNFYGTAILKNSY